jgi:hypothetical protein
MRHVRPALLLVLVFLAATAAIAQTTGSAAGRVTAADGSALPGVTVEATSPALQGTRTTVSDADGTFRLPLLPPGEYRFTFNLSGFQGKSKTAAVGLGQQTAVDATLQVSSVSEEVIVTAAAPVLDTSSASLGANLSKRAIETLPTARNYASIVQVAPGVSSDANPEQKADVISVYGSSGAENSFYVDGVNTTNMEYGFQGKELNFEFIDEIDVKTGGYEAEFGRSTGGIISVITKSGGNQFTGDLFTYYDNDSLQSNAHTVVNDNGTPLGFTKKDFGLDAGGFLMRDKLWFFAAYDGVRNERQSGLPAGGPRAGEPVTSKSHRDLGSAKLTWNVGASQSIVATFLQDPRIDTGAIIDGGHTINGDESTYLGRQDFGGRDVGLRYDGALASSWIVNAQVSRHRENNSVSGSGSDAIQYRNGDNEFFQTGGFGLIQTKQFARKFYGGAVTRLFAHHEVKAGLELEDETADVVKRMSGGQRVDVFSNDANAAKPIYVHSYWTTPDATLANAPVSQLNASPQHKNTTLFLQDRWTVRDLVVNYGVRWDRQRIIDASGVTQIDMKKDFAPRLGITWDPSGTHRSKIFGSYGRFYEQLPMDLVIRSFSYERQPRIVNYSPTSTVPDAAAEKDYGTKSGILGGFTEPADPNLRNQYLNEYILGGEREIAPNLAVGIKGIYRSYGNVIEDFLCADDGTYCIGNPGRGIMKDIFTLDYSQTLPAPKPKRTYKGVQLDATKRYANNWQAIASYIYSKLDGNFDGEYAPFTNVGADPNISAAYDYYDFFTNGKDAGITNNGPLSNDRRHQFKVSGVYYTPWKLSIGASAFWRSGTPLTRYGYSDAYSRWEFFLTPRGGEGRSPSNYEADVHLGYPIDAGSAKISLLLDVFNILNAQRPVLLDQRYAFSEEHNFDTTPRAGYLAPVVRTNPTSARFGVRVSF